MCLSQMFHICTLYGPCRRSVKRWRPHDESRTRTCISNTAWPRIIENVKTKCYIFSEFNLSGTRPLLLKMLEIWVLCQNGLLHSRQNLHDCTFIQPSTYSIKFEKLCNPLFKKLAPKLGQLAHSVTIVFIRFTIHY